MFLPPVGIDVPVGDEHRWPGEGDPSPDRDHHFAPGHLGQSPARLRHGAGDGPTSPRTPRCRTTAFRREPCPIPAWPPVRGLDLTNSRWRHRGTPAGAAVAPAMSPTSAYVSTTATACGFGMRHRSPRPCGHRRPSAPSRHRLRPRHRPIPMVTSPLVRFGPSGGRPWSGL